VAQNWEYCTRTHHGHKPSLEYNNKLPQKQLFPLVPHSLFLLNFYETCIEARWITFHPKNDKTGSKIGYRLYTSPQDSDGNFSALRSDVVCWTDRRARYCYQTSFLRRIALNSAISFQGSATLQNVIEHFEPHLQTSPFPLLYFSTHLSELRVCDLWSSEYKQKEEGMIIILYVHSSAYSLAEMKAKINTMNKNFTLKQATKAQTGSGRIALLCL